ncbi:MAG: GNAT family N-acetyltransferase [Rhodospirillaceae bacterium]|nr:GNAT family N-acetyltransferase [Rhodospirillaceae bacterium]MBT3928572.1 GNAT family N-acetyltransferase [Rhodospirillaceae bacterium]MBT4425604.1 GNAT family N-acetyltransferase [Rhodospirillaceae bacterium]MBT5039863.1 GNAT family N-acetyltransferase [Rhodospirillaceae bacterium]MBT5674292.1 GNAT family N-acetyltransferase [Rhodospirillaceae bacterium]
MSVLRTTRTDRDESQLLGANVRVRPPELRDWQDWAELRTASRDFLVPWEPAWASDAHSRAAYRRRLRRQQRDASDDICYSYFLTRLADNALMGGITLSNIQRGVAQTCNVGYWIGEPYARSGYMTEGLKCALRYCFGSLGLHRVEAACMPNNSASQALLQRCGFRREGYARKFLKINGVWRDHLLFAVIEDEWRRPD